MMSDSSSTSALTPSWRGTRLYVRPQLRLLEERHGRPILCRLQVLEGAQSLLDAQPLLTRLAVRSGQEGETDNLSFFLGMGTAARRNACVVLVYRRDPGPQSEGSAYREDRLLGAVLLLRYHRLGLPLGIYSTQDGSGRRNVIAPPELRLYVATEVARVLVERGAHMIRLDLQEGSDNGSGDGLVQAMLGADRTSSGSNTQGWPAGRRRWATRRTEMPLYLPLGENLDATLAGIGQRTRSNMRYYRRKAEREFGCTYIPQVTIDREELVAFNRLGDQYRGPDENARERFDSFAILSGHFLAGLRDRDGNWLALLSGRRQAGRVEIDWQMNRADLAHASLSLVMRCYLIEDSIRLGDRKLYIEGGTTHPLRNSFVLATITELTVVRDTLFSRLLRRFTARFYAPSNHDFRAVTSPRQNWRRW